MRFPLLLGLSLGLSFGLQAQGDARPYLDIHLNSSDKPFNSRTGGGYDIWTPIFHSCGAERAPKFMQLYGNRYLKQSQAHFEALVRGNVRLGMLSVSPIEQPIINSSNLLDEKSKRATISCITGITANQLFLRRREVDYFDDLVQNIEFLQRFETQPYYYNGFPYEYSLIRSKEDIDSILANPNQIGLFLTVEGGHSLGHSIYINEKITTLPEYRDLVLQNVKRLKGLLPLNEATGEYLRTPILWMSLCKTFDNGLGGEALALSGGQQTALMKSPSLGQGPTKLGQEVIRDLISKEGRRVLVDIKHMSLAFRKYYYSVVESAGILGNTVPIVVSHCGVSNLSWKNPLYKSRDTDDKNNNSYLNQWEQNMALEDIDKIFKTKGLIGISLDKTVIAGQLAINEIESTLPGSAQRRTACVKVFLANVLTVIDVTGDKSAWDIVCLGSDFDGMNEPLDPYYSAAQIPELAHDIQRFLEKPEAIGDLFKAEDIKRLMFDYSAEDIVRKILFSNALEFAKRNIDDRKLRGRRIN